MTMWQTILKVALICRLCTFLSTALCLPDAIPAKDRAHITIDEVTGPLGLHENSWTTAKLLTHIFKIVVEEVLGYNVTVATQGRSSGSAVWAIAGCSDGSPCTLGADTKSKSHLAFEIWQNYIGNALPLLKQNNPERKPQSIGTVGYFGKEGTFLKETVRTAGQSLGLILDFYRGYEASTNPGIGFDTYDQIPVASLARCDASKPFIQAVIMKNYLDLYNDTAGETCPSSGNDTLSYWWFSPACRADPQKCVPYVTTLGYGAEAIMHQAAEFDMPVAIASTRSIPLFRSNLKDWKTLVYCFMPAEDCAGFDLTKMQGPMYVADEYNRGKKSTDAAEQPLYTYAHKHLKRQAPKIQATAEAMKITMNQIMGMLSESASTPSAEDVACNFLKNNPDVYKSWIPDDKACGIGQGLINDKCEFCPPATRSAPHPNISISRLCEDCPAGKSQGQMGLSVCTICEKGKYAGSGMASCTFCPRGSYSSEKQGSCTPCQAKTTTATIASTNVSDCICDLGFYSIGGGACEACPRGSSTDDIGSKSVEACLCQKGWYMPRNKELGCQPCVFGMTCEKGSGMKNYDDYTNGVTNTMFFPKNAPGFMSTPSDPLSIFDCQSTERCPGGIPGQCGTNAAGLSCGRCLDDHYGKADGCYRCGDQVVSMVLFPSVPTIGLPLLLLGLYRLFRDAPGRWGTWQNELISLGYIMLTHYQMASIIGSSGITPPPRAKPMWGAWGITKDVTSVFNKECAGFAGFQAQFVTTSLGPLIVLAFAALLYGSSKIVNPRFNQEPLQFDRMNNVFFSLIYTFFPGIVDMSMALFMCHQNPNGKDTLLQDRTIICGEDEWKSMLGVAIVAVLLYCVMCMAIFAWAVCTVAGKDEAFLMRWKFLFIKYRMSVSWWGIAILSKVVALIVGIVAIEDSLAQLCWVMILCCIYTYLLFMYTPWRSYAANILDCVVNVNIIMLCGIFMWFIPRNDDVVFAAETMSMVVACIPFAFFGMCVVYLGKPIIRQHMTGVDQTGKKTTITEVQWFCAVFDAMETEEVSKALATISNMDLIFLKRALVALHRDSSVFSC